MITARADVDLVERMRRQMGAEDRTELEELRSAIDGIRATAARAHELRCDPTVYGDIVTLAEIALGTDENQDGGS